MAERSFPFNSIAGDRKYKAERWREYFAMFIGNGIFYKNANALKVKENEGMMVTLQEGAAWVAGGGYINEGQKHFTLEMADGVLPRIDRIVIRCDYVLRDIYATVKKEATVRSRRRRRYRGTQMPTSWQLQISTSGGVQYQ